VREVLVVAGETSGDLHASGVAAELRRLAPDVALTGIGGARMERAGVALLEHTDRLAVMGFAEVIRHVPRHYQLLGMLRRRLRSGQVGLVMLVDYPGFNMKVAAAARAAGVPVLYYVTPQVWAWGRGRLRALARTVSRAAVILPFEEELLRRHGIDATFVGHPLLDRASELLPDRAAARARLGLAPDATVLALFPGSRAQEISRHLGRFVETARELERRIPGLVPIVSVAAGLTLDEAQCPYPQVRDASFTLRARHYWTRLTYTNTYFLNDDGSRADVPFVDGYDRNFNAVNLDAVFTWQFAPGSFMTVAWKNAAFQTDGESRFNYADNARHTWDTPKSNQLSVKMIYYLDYIKVRGWFRKR